MLVQEERCNDIVGIRTYDNLKRKIPNWTWKYNWMDRLILISTQSNRFFSFFSSYNYNFVREYLIDERDIDSPGATFNEVLIYKCTSKQRYEADFCRASCRTISNPAKRERERERHTETTKRAYKRVYTKYGIKEATAFMDVLPVTSRN